MMGILFIEFSLGGKTMTWIIIPIIITFGFSMGCNTEKQNEAEIKSTSVTLFTKLTSNNSPIGYVDEIQNQGETNRSYREKNALIAANLNLTFVNRLKKLARKHMGLAKFSKTAGTGKVEVTFAKNFSSVSRIKGGKIPSDKISIRLGAEDFNQNKNNTALLDIMIRSAEVLSGIPIDNSTLGSQTIQTFTLGRYFWKFEKNHINGFLASIKQLDHWPLLPNEKEISFGAFLNPDQTNRTAAPCSGPVGFKALESGSGYDFFFRTRCVEAPDEFNFLQASLDSFHRRYY
jgi:hypothetical protein